MSNSSLHDRIHGRAPRTDLRANNHKLTETKELTLVQWILSIDERGYPPRIYTVRKAAKLLLKQHIALPSALIGQNWPHNFVNCRPKLKVKYTHKYDYQRAQCKNPDKLQDWFRLVQNIIYKYGIIADNIYNFNEIGYTIGIIGTIHIITKSDQRGRPITIQPGDHEWVTLIKGISLYS